jgi:hypothetical protein
VVGSVGVLGITCGAFIFDGTTGVVQSVAGALVSVVGIGSLALLVSMLSSDPLNKTKKLAGISLLLLKLPLLAFFIYLGTWSRGPGLYAFFASIALVYCASIWAIARKNTS